MFKYLKSKHCKPGNSQKDVDMTEWLNNDDNKTGIYISPRVYNMVLKHEQVHSVYLECILEHQKMKFISKLTGNWFKILFQS